MKIQLINLFLLICHTSSFFPMGYKNFLNGIRSYKGNEMFDSSIKRVYFFYLNYFGRIKMI